MSNKAYNQSFAMYMEGVLTPFNSATIMCTPNGVEANINVPSNVYILDIKPKTAIQIFYQDWVYDNKPSWRLMFDGYFSSFYKSDQSGGGRGIGLVCRDFRMDMRRAPAALAYSGEQELTVKNYFHSHGIFHTRVVKGITPKSKTGKDGKPTTQQGKEIRTYDTTGLSNLSESIAYIAGTAYGKGLNITKDGEYHYTNGYSTCLKEDVNGKARCGLFLDAVIRGLWMEAVGGTSVCSFLNKRIRVDKKFLVPNNRAGYNFWNRGNAGVDVGAYLMGNSQFSSIEAAIMRLAGLFSTRVYSCSTPSLIPLSEEVNGRKNYALEFIMDEDVRKFLVERSSAEFGGKYILNESMLLPPLEFTAPPNCNIMFPPMYDRVEWQYDMDVDVTRGYFSVTPSISSPDSKDLAVKGVQVPNALFNINTKQGDKSDDYGRVKPALTLEERYKGVNVIHGNVDYNIAADDAVSAFIDSTFSPAKSEKLKAEISRIREVYTKKISDADYSEGIFKEMLNDQQREEVDATLKAKREAILSRSGKNEDPGTTKTYESIKRHAVIKFLNSKYSGRVVSVDMHFNPYVMSGFPGLVIGDDAEYGQASKNILGTVQQVKHQIVISAEGAEAATSVVMSNARFDDEPTDVDPMGSPLYMKPTNPYLAEVDPVTCTYKFDPLYRVPDPVPVTMDDLNNKKYDLNVNKDYGKGLFVKDILTLSKKEVSGSKSNGVYLDEEYEPNRIARFYKFVFQHRENSFMVGVAASEYQSGKMIPFMYDTMHEAITNLRIKKSELLHDYEGAMKYVSRDICSADAFFQGILGLSVKSEEDDEESNRKVVYYKNQTENFDHSVIHDEYYGLTTSGFDGNDFDGLKKVNGGLMDGPGQMSSIMETMPATAFIDERKIAVKKYVKEAMKQLQGVSYASL
jgi:hypothetical protein